MKWTRGVVQRKLIWGEGLFTLQIRAPEVEAFEPGQFLQLGLEQETGHLHRPYSVASPHGEILDFFIVLVEDGRLTPQLWQLDEGSEIDISARAAGSFTLSHCPATARQIWLIATGTGLAPYIAMMRKEEVWQRFEHVIVVHGVRYGPDLAYQPELAEHRARHGEKFTYIPMVSRDTTEGAMSGRITSAIEDGRLEQAAGVPFAPDCCIMMCGNPEMLKEAERLLEQKGLRRHRPKETGQIVVERYW